MTAPGVIERLATALDEDGLILRGGFVFGAHEWAPAGLSGRPARSIILIGQAGVAPWPSFLRWLERQESRGLSDPLDKWSSEVIGKAARMVSARAVSPSDKPYLPFQQWAMRAEGLRPSPLGVLMHPEFGLWHAFRGALLFDVEIAFPEPPAAVHLCDGCIDKPCLHACPVEAHSTAGFDHATCLDHVRSASGHACMHH